MEIVDAQVHLNQIVSDWQTARPEAVVDTAVAVMNALGVDAVVVAEFMGFDEQRRQKPGYDLPNGSRRFTYPVSEQAVKRYPDRFAYVFRIDPDDPDIEDVVASIPTTPGARAIRLVPTVETGQVALFEQGGYERIFAAAQQHAVPIFVFMPGRAHMLVPYLKKFENLQIILDHVGVHGMRPQEFRPAAAEHVRGIAELSQYPNLAVKWCHAASHLSSQEYPYDDLIPHLMHLIEAFGPQRLAWASDHTVSKVHHSWAEDFRYVLDSSRLSQSDKEWLLGRTTRTILKWS